MDWFLYDNDLRHERVKLNHFKEFIQLYFLFYESENGFIIIIS